MEDNSFLYFTQDNIISKIDIDPRLIDSFKRVMKKMQEYYNANGYTNQRNYREYLEKYLLHSGDNNLRIYINKIEQKGVGGFYSKYKNEICINENKLNASSDILDSTLCHEFTHFIVKHSLERGKADPQIVNGGFINEALTEMMTQQMYPNSNAYDAQVAMHKFANSISGKVNNYSKFLKGEIDARWSSPDWENYVAAANRFQRDFNEKGYINLNEAQTNTNFIEAQRKLISLFIRPNSVKTFEEYCESIIKMMNRPVNDQEFINQVVSTMDNLMVKQLNIKSSSLNSFLISKLSEVRELLKDSQKYNGKKVYEFEFAGRKLVLDENMNLSGNYFGISRGWNPSTKTITLQLGSDKIQLNADEINFDLRDIEIQRKLAELSSYYSKDSKINLSMIEQAMEQTGELSKIEKFTLPMVGIDGRKKPYSIYVATYGDKLVVLNNCEQIGNISNIPLNRFIGMTSNDPRTSAIYSEKIGTLESGMLFTTLNEKGIEIRAINEYAKRLSALLSNDEITRAINQYRQSDLFDESDTDEMIHDEAIKNIARERYENLSVEEKQELIQIVKESSDRFVVDMKNGVVNVSAIHGKEIITAFKGTSQLLYDSKGQGLYATFYEELKKEKGDVQSNLKNQISIDQNGNMIIEREEIKTEERKTNEELLAEANKQIEELKNQYAQVATEIENLMKQNNQAPVQDYQQRLNTLLQKRDLINEKVSPILESQRVYQSIIDNKKKEEHKAVLSQVERILNYRITDTAGYEYNSELKAPQVLAKDKSTLREEQGRITTQLDNMYYDGQLDMKTWKTMKSHIRTEFDEMIKNAPAPVQAQNNNSQQNQQSQNSNSQHGTYSEQAEHMNGYSGGFNRKFKSVDATTNDTLHSRSEEEIEQMRIQLEREQLKEKYGLSDDMLDEIIRQQQILEFQNNQADNIEQTEQIEHTGHRMR